MTDSELADLIIERLNKILDYDKNAISNLLSTRVLCNQAIADHPTVQVLFTGSVTKVGVLGLINGLVGVIPEGKYKNWGYITAEVDDDDNILYFRKTGSK